VLCLSSFLFRVLVGQVLVLVLVGPVLVLVLAGLVFVLVALILVLVLVLVGPVLLLVGQVLVLVLVGPVLVNITAVDAERRRRTVQQCTAHTATDQGRFLVERQTAQLVRLTVHRYRRPAACVQTERRRPTGERRL